MEPAAAVAVYVALGVVRPRWTTFFAAGVPTVLAFAWLLMHEAIPGEQSGLIDLVWYAGMSLVVGVALAVATAVGVALRRTAAHCARAGPRSTESQ